jgi:threonine dehydrogenase-like Zn-dependent dehydrogenase
MKAIVYHAPRDFRVESVPDPKLLAAGDAVVRIERTAICGSDLHLWHGSPLPVSFVMGHEFMGVVEDVGSDVRRFRRGDRVLAACTLGCGSCSMCARELYSGCLELTRAGPLSNIFGSPLHPGGQAEGARVPFADANLMRVPDSLADEQALFLTDILPTGYMGSELAEAGPGDVVVVFGCGPVGTFAQRGALLRGAACVVAVDLDDGRLAKAAKRGCRPLHPEREDLLEVVRGLTGGRGADCAVEAVGRAELVQRAIDVVRAGGRIGVVGIVMGGTVPLQFMPQVLGKNLTIRAATVNPQRYWRELVPLIEQGRLDPTEIITHRMRLADGIRGYRIFDAHEEDVLKVVLQP